jgi:hypothetical protein
VTDERLDHAQELHEQLQLARPASSPTKHTSLRIRHAAANILISFLAQFDLQVGCTDGQD